MTSAYRPAVRDSWRRRPSRYSQTITRLFRALQTVSACRAARPNSRFEKRRHQRVSKIAQAQVEKARLSFRCDVDRLLKRCDTQNETAPCRV